MDYITVILSAVIIGLILDRFLPAYFSKKGENLATQEDIGKITKEIESVKNIFRDQYSLSKMEREFYYGMIEAIYKFLADIKRYELDYNTKVTREVSLTNQTLKENYLTFIDTANKFVGKSYVFLSEENFQNLKEALNTSSNFNELTKNLLYAMRKSLHSDTQLKPTEDNLKEFQYK